MAARPTWDSVSGVMVVTAGNIAVAANCQRTELVPEVQGEDMLAREEVALGMCQPKSGWRFSPRLFAGGLGLGAGSGLLLAGRL